MFKLTTLVYISLLFFNSSLAQEQRVGVDQSNIDNLSGSSGMNSGQVIYFAEDFSDGGIPAGWANDDPSGNGAL